MAIIIRRGYSTSYVTGPTYEVIGSPARDRIDFYVVGMFPAQMIIGFIICHITVKVMFAFYANCDHVFLFLIEGVKAEADPHPPEENASLLSGS